MSTYNEWVQVSFDDDSVLGFDNDGNYSTVTNTYITAQGGTHRFQTRFNVFASSMAAGAEFNVIARISKGTVSQGSQTVTLTEGQFGTGDIDFINFQVEFLASTSEGVQVEVYIQDPDGVATPVQIIGNTLGSDPTAVYFSCTAAPGGQVQIPQCLPRIKQKDFMSDLCQRFNLVIESDPDNPQNLYIEPYADWIGDGADAYWTDKLDLDKERTLMPTSSIKSARINFADKESGDIGNAFIKDTQGEVFGAYDQDIDDDFATGELTNSPVFSPYFVYTVPTLQGDPLTFNESFLIHRSYQRDGAGVKPISQPPKLFFAIGSQDILDTYYIDNTAFTSYLFCSPLSESPLDADTQSLYWNSPSLPFSITNDLMAAGETPAIGLHRQYWASYLADIYDADARVFEAHLYLTPSDIRTVRFNDRFHILGATYKLTEISGYQIGTGESTLCKFLRDLSRSSFGSCDAIPTQSNGNGTVTFTNPDGTTTVNPGQQCCEAFGYYYDAETNTCRWNSPSDGDGGPVPPVPPVDPSDPFPNTNGDNPGPVSPTGTSTTTVDPDSGTVTVFDDFMLTAETNDTTPTDATAPKGTVITVDENTIATGVMRVNTTTVGGTAGTAFTSSFETWRFLANGRAGSVTFSATTGTLLTSGTAGTRDPRASISNGVLTFQVVGLSNQIINWTLKVEMVRIYATNETEFRDAMLTEAGARLAGIDDRVIIQE